MGLVELSAIFSGDNISAGSLHGILHTNISLNGIKGPLLHYVLNQSQKLGHPTQYAEGDSIRLQLCLKQ